MSRKTLINLIETLFEFTFSSDPKFARSERFNRVNVMDRSYLILVCYSKDVFKFFGTK